EARRPQERRCLLHAAGRAGRSQRPGLGADCAAGGSEARRDRGAGTNRAGQDHRRRCAPEDEARAPLAFEREKVALEKELKLLDLQIARERRQHDMARDAAKTMMDAAERVEDARKRAGATAPAPLVS